MKIFLLGAASILALAAPGAAGAQTGYVGADYINTDVDGLGSDDAWGASGAVSLSDNFAADAGFFDNDGASAWSVTGHGFVNSDTHLFGAFLSYGDDDVSSTLGGGLEAQAYMNDWTFAGALSYARDDDADVSATGVNGEARYFVSDNFRLEGGAGWFNIDTPLGDDDALALGVGGEYQFASAPISVGLGYTHTTLDTADLNADSVSLTARWNFGGTLHDRDHSGAGLAGLSGGGSALGL